MLWEVAVSFYGRHVLPRVIDLVGREKSAADLRKRMIPSARGVVVELGIGSALNLPFYSATAVTQLYGVDPSAELLSMGRPKIEGSPFPIDLLRQSADHVPLGDQTVDTVVTTWVMCSIVNAASVLGEMKRVLKSEGRLMFIEHGLSPDPRVQKWQNRITPIWSRLGGGCCVNKKIDDLIRGSGFTIMELQNLYIPGPRSLKYIYQRCARPVRYAGFPSAQRESNAVSSRVPR